MADLFVAYSPEDKARAAEVVRLLEDHGWSVFWDQEPRADSLWPKVLEDELGKARCLVALWTTTSVASRWVRIEAYEALQNDKLLPVLLDNVRLPLEFRPMQTFDLVDWNGDRDDARLVPLLADLTALANIPPTLRRREMRAATPTHDIECDASPRAAPQPSVQPTVEYGALPLGAPSSIAEVDEPQAMRGIRIIYRQGDADGQAGRLFDDLSAHLGRDAVFMDVAGIKKGLDFRRIIDEHVASCGVLLVITGKRWLSVTDNKGKRRLDDPNDFVRLEIAAALSRDIPVVPVLVHDAVMPTEQELPEVLKQLAFRNGTELTAAQWDSDVRLLIQSLMPYLTMTVSSAAESPAAASAAESPAAASAAEEPAAASAAEEDPFGNVGAAPVEPLTGSSAADRSLDDWLGSVDAVPEDPLTGSPPAGLSLDELFGLGAVPGDPLSLEAPMAPVPKTPASLPAARREATTAAADATTARTPEAEPVDAAVFCASSVGRATAFLVQVFLYPPALAEVARAEAREADAGAERRGMVSLPLDLPRGTRIDLRLEMPGLRVDEPDTRIVWRGTLTVAQFDVAVPAEAGLGTVIGRIRFSIAGVPAGILRFQVTVSAVNTGETAHAAEVVVRRYRRAFVSYASTDRAEVLRRVQAIRIAGLSVFQDVLNLEPGERWERELYRAIDDCDVVLLFWSKAAAASPWVAKEIDYALARKQGQDDRPPDIQPVPIEGPPIPMPPDKLRHLHFNDALLAQIAAAQQTH